MSDESPCSHGGTDCILITGPDGRVVAANQRIFALSGLAPDEVIGKLVAEIDGWIAVEDRLRLVSVLGEPGGIRSLQVWLCDGDGELTPHRVTVHPCRIAGEDCVIVLARDASGVRGGGPDCEARLDTIIESIPFGLFIIDENGRYIMQNSVSRARWGNVVGLLPNEVAPTEDILALWLENNRRAFAGEVVSGEVSFALADEELHYHNVISPVRSDGRVRAIVGINIDISKRKRAENLVRAQRDLAISLAAARDQKHALELCLQAALDLTGMECGGIYLADDCGNLDLRCSRGLSDDFIAAVSHFDAETPNARLVARGEPVYTHFRDLESPPEKVEHSFRALAVVPIGHHGRVIGCVNLASFERDEVPLVAGQALEALTAQIGGALARIEVEERLRKREAWFRVIERAVTDVIWTTDMDLRNTYISPSVLRQRGFTPEEVLSQSVEQVLTPQASVKVREVMLARLRNHPEQLQDPITVVVEVLRKDGTTFPAETSASFLLDDAGKPVGLIGVTRDISERVRAEQERAEIEEQLRHTQKLEAMGTLAGGIAHDFNNLLQGILGYAGLLKSPATSPEFTLEAAEVIERAARRAAELTQQLLGFARSGTLRATTVDLHRLIDSVATILIRTIDRRIVVQRRLQAAPAVVRGDPGQLEQVLMNLAVNARDAMPDGGELSFETETVNLEEHVLGHPEAIPGKLLVVSVRDTGCGISPELRKHIFDPFFTTKQPGQGTGMGLAMVYGIVKSHGGWIEVDSAPGRGAVFRVLLPASDAALPEVPATEQSHTAGRGLVLVVDDEETVRAALSGMLMTLGYHVMTAVEGQEAVQLYRTHSSEIDVVLLDMTMPVMDGRTCFRELKALDPEVRVVLSTGHALEDTARQLAGEGLTGLIHKPYDLQQLSQAMEQALAKGRPPTLG